MDPGIPNRPKKRDDFEVAIICALTLEADAVITLFDHHWEGDGFSYGKARGDPNAYSIGVIGQHNVVLAHLPGMGKVSAGNIAAFCRMGFPNIKLALLVGVCGGSPYYNNGKSQIRLGDVVVSTGIVQYDFGRRFPDQFEIKDSLNDTPGRPNLEIRNLLSKLMTARQRDTVMKSANDRDHIAKQMQVLGFEMESVGVWEVFPCVVIKSVCDYADSHKSKDWQPYAAACAASYAKGFLRYWDPTTCAEPSSKPEQFRKRIIKSLSYSDMNERRNNIQSEAPSTFNWVFEESVEYPREQGLDSLSAQDSDTTRHHETGWKADLAPNAEAGKEGSFEAGDNNGTGWETASDEESEQEGSLEDDEDDEASWETTSDEKSGEEGSLEADDDMGTDWATESDDRSVTSEDSTPSGRQWRHWDSFIDWLKSDLPVYWITGKPGSGKSTLMKFLISDSRTPAALKEWMKDTIIIAHFFWKPGSTMQHSFKGLLCSLLCLILKNDKSISHSVLKRMIKDKDGKESPSDWDQRELRDLLLHYRNHSSQPICIFIDALDEIPPEQDTLDALHMLRALISPTIKICVSSRPERLFRLHLQDKPSLEIHKLTGPDIEHYSKVSIRDSILLELQGLKVSDLARRIGEMSQGVFLWAVLVTRSLIRGINNGDSERDIYRRLNSTPQDLMDLYRDILMRSAADRDIYKQYASMIFNLVLILNGIPMPLFEATVATDGPLLDQLVVQGKGIHAQDLVTKGLRMVNTLEVGCAGLLEVRSSMKENSPTFRLKPLLAWLDTTITFIHRSAEEFLLDTEDGRKLWESCLCSQEELLIRRAKAKLAWGKPLGEDGNVLHDREIVEFMIENGYNPNWPGSSETTTCKFGSPWLQYLLTLHRQLSHTAKVRVHEVIRPASRLELPEAASHMKAIAFGNYEEKKYFLVETNWVSELLLEGVKFWFQHATRKGDDRKLDNKVMTIFSFVTGFVSEASCRQSPWPFKFCYAS
ncbi:hypothetical protein FPRO06_13043 [Fusarium proliferatum]|nr:hypothetical protein FPRO06_13043 [Fusarium proliferatum]